jgi:hypothetical protein
MDQNNSLIVVELNRHRTEYHAAELYAVRITVFNKLNLKLGA